MNIETTLRERMTDSAEALDLPEDPWPAFAGRERHHRRVRRTRAGVVAAALAVLVVLQSGVVPMPGWAPGIAIAATNDALLDSPARGSLAGDTAWLDGMRAQVRDLEEAEERWRVADRSRIRFLYAADIGDSRLVLMHIPLRWGFLTDSVLKWYEGPAGATPAEMYESDHSDGRAQAAVKTSVDARTRAYAVVVAPVGTTVSTSEGYTYGADGRVHHNPPVSGPAGGGIAELVFPAGSTREITAWLTGNGPQTRIDLVAGGSDGTVPQLDLAPYRALAADALGDRSFDPGLLAAWVHDAADGHSLPLDGLRLDVRWTGELDGKPFAVFTLQQPGAGVLAFAMRNYDQPGTPVQYLRLLLPADGADRRPLGWRTRDPQGSAPTDRVHIVAPAGAARVTVDVAGGARSEVPLDASGHGEARISPDAAATMTAYAANGAEIGSSPLTGFTDGGGITGDTADTRVVP